MVLLGEATHGTSEFYRMRARLTKVGDLWKPLLAARGRVNLATFFGSGT